MTIAAAFVGAAIIFLLSHGLQVTGIDARLDQASVVDMHSLRDWPFEDSPRYPMRGLKFFAVPKDAILFSGCIPDPASAFRDAFYFFFETLNYFWSHENLHSVQNPRLCNFGSSFVRRPAPMSVR